MLYVRQLRIEKGIKQTDVAKVLGISKQLYNHYELGKRQADYEMLLKMSEYFDTSVEFLLTGKHSGILEADPEKRLEMLHEKHHNDNSEIITEIKAALAELSEHDLRLVLALCRAMIDTRTNCEK